MVTVQLPDVRAQLEATVPLVVSDEVRVTVPDGTLATLVTSAIATEQEPVRPTVTELEQETLVEVSSFTTVIVPDVPTLPLWPGKELESPPYVPVTVAVPGATPVNITLQLPPVSVQLALTVPTVVSEDWNETVPVGMFVGVVVSATVAVHADVAPMLMLAGVQLTLVEVLSFVGALTVMAAETPTLPL